MDHLRIPLVYLGSVPRHCLLHTVLKINPRSPTEFLPRFGVVAYASGNVDAPSLWVPVDFRLYAANLHDGFNYLLDRPLFSTAEMVDLRGPAFFREEGIASDDVLDVAEVSSRGGIAHCEFLSSQQSED